MNMVKQVPAVVLLIMASFAALSAPLEPSKAVDPDVIAVAQPALAEVVTSTTTATDPSKENFVRSEWLKELRAHSQEWWAVATEKWEVLNGSLTEKFVEEAPTLSEESSTLKTPVENPPLQ